MSRIRLIWNRWKIIAHQIGIFQSRFVLSLFYFIILLPLGLLFTLFLDTLKLKKKQTSTWVKKRGKSPTLLLLAQQF